MLPDFIGIGAQRSGTTWLHALLASHPDIYVPERRKEIHFFDWYYDRGSAWYASFFNPKAAPTSYRAIGEITPDYLYEPAAPERIAALVPSCKLLVILRNPVDRAYSHYAKLVRDDRWQASFEETLTQRPEIIERGFYSKWLKNYFAVFPREQILPILYETAVSDVATTKSVVSTFLNVREGDFPNDAGNARVHESHVPKLTFLYAASKELARWLRRSNLDSVVNTASRLGVKKVYGNGEPLPAMHEATRRELQSVYAADIGELQELLNLDVGLWRAPTVRSEQVLRVATP